MFMHSMRSFCATIEYSSRRFPFRYLSVLKVLGVKPKETCMPKEPEGCTPREYVTHPYRRTISMNIRDPHTMHRLHLYGLCLKF